MPRQKKEIKQTELKIPDPLPSDLYEVLACPIDKADVHYTEGKTGLKCTKCKYIYPIRDGIPVLLPPEMQERQSL